jgi:hypothetical protein
VQLGADVEQEHAGGLHVGGGPVDQLGRGERVDQLDVAQAAVAVLEVGFHPVRHIADLAPALLRAVGELVEPAADPGPPRLADRGADLLRELRVARDVPGLEQAEGGAQIGGGDLHGLARGADGVVEPDPGVPERVPQVTGEPVDVLAAVVQQDEVEVRPRRQLPTAERPDRDQRGAIGQPDRGGS